MLKIVWPGLEDDASHPDVPPSQHSAPERDNYRWRKLYCKTSNKDNVANFLEGWLILKQHAWFFNYEEAKRQGKLCCKQKSLSIDFIDERQISCLGKHDLVFSKTGRKLLRLLLKRQF